MTRSEPAGAEGRQEVDMALQRELGRRTGRPDTMLEVAWRQVLGDAPEVPRAAWADLLEGYSDRFYDLACRLWILEEDGIGWVLAEDVPLGQVYMDPKGSERGAVQVAVNRSVSVYGDCRFIHRIRAPVAIHLRDGVDGELADLIVVSAARVTVLEVSLPERPAPSPRRRAWPSAHLPAAGAPRRQEPRRTP